MWSEMTTSCGRSGTRVTHSADYPHRSRIPPPDKVVVGNRTRGIQGTVRYAQLIVCMLFAIGVRDTANALGQTRVDPLNVLLLVSDDQRADTIHALGNEWIRTPNLDRLVAEGTSFTRAIAASPVCVPSRLSLMTGREIVGVSGELLKQRTWAARTNLARAHRQAGYHTTYVGKWHSPLHPHDWGYDLTAGMFAAGGQRWWKPQFDHAGRPVTGSAGWVFQADHRTGLRTATFAIAIGLGLVAMVLLRRSHLRRSVSKWRLVAFVALGAVGVVAVKGVHVLDAEFLRLQPQRGVGLQPNMSAILADEAIGVISESQPDRPFFLHVNFTAPHDPLLLPPNPADHYRADQVPAPANFLEKHAFDHGNLHGRDEQLFHPVRTREEVQAELAVYYAVITDMDRQIGRIIAALQDTGQLERTLVVFVSDHGLAIGSHGLRGKQNMYEHTLGIPLIMRGPGVPSGQRRDAQCYIRDLFPTICELASLDSPPGLDGQSLKPVLDDPATIVHSHVFASYDDKQRMVRSRDWKLVQYSQIGREQLFNLSNDPLEMHDLASDQRHASELRDLRSRLDAHWNRQFKIP